MISSIFCFNYTPTQTPPHTHQLRRGMLDHVSDVFVDTSYPVIDLMENAERGNLEKMEEKMTAYLRHAREIEKVSTYVSQVLTALPWTQYTYVGISQFENLKEIPFLTKFIKRV